MKINVNGEYRPFYGWSVISNVNNISFIEQYIINNKISKYFSALPASSYHMTLYNIWCNGRQLLTTQKEYIEKCENKTREKLYNYSTRIGYPFNPDGCINGLLKELQLIINKEEYLKEIQIEYSKIVYTGSSLAILVRIPDNFTYFNNVRQKIANKVGEENDGLNYYHITLAYQYNKFIDDEKNITEEINFLDKILKNQSFAIGKPFVSYFEDMTSFKKVFNNKRHCLGFVVPDKHTQLKLKEYGFDLDAPMKSFNDNMKIIDQNTTFGGVHISILHRREYNENIYKILEIIAEEIHNEKPWKLPVSSKINRGKYQSNINFTCPNLTRASNKAESLGITGTVKEHYHIGLYSSELTLRHTYDQESKILSCLKEANWGFILSIDDGNKKFKYDWNTFTPI